MAFLGKKSDDGSPKPAKAPKPPKAPKAPKAPRGKKGKKGEPAAPPLLPGDTVDLSDFAAEAGAAQPLPIPPARPAKTMKNGSIVGLNIGQHSIKVVEITVKGGELSLTGLGQAPTPPESITNGVVINTTALAGSIKGLLKSAGIKSKKTVTSVSGTGSLVVRVIEVPRMSDGELEENMRQDAERYIPFPPSEVIMDFKALRELPSDPDAPNMEVLLAAAQREIVDAHIGVVDKAKLDPRAIDVEPLACARAMTEVGVLDEVVDYYDVTALINLGATMTEISVLRGDLLVFTRIIPKGGNDLTQTLVDHLALPWHDAERLKMEMADALPPLTGSVPVATDDWSDFGMAPAPSGNPFAATATAVAPRVSDQFDPAFYEQGPSNAEPGEQHGQKENEPFNFDFSFDLSQGEAKPEEPAAAAEPAVSTESAPSAAFDFAFSDTTDAAPPAEQAVGAPPAAAPLTFSMEPAPQPVSPQGDQALPSVSDNPVAPDTEVEFAFDSPEDSAATPATTDGFNLAAGDAPADSAQGAASVPDTASTLDLPDFDTLVAQSQTEDQAPASGTADVAFDLTEFEGLDDTAPLKADAASDDEEEFDIAGMFGDDVAGTDDVAAFDAPSDTPTAASDDFGFGDLGGFENFGAGLAGAEETSTAGIDAATVYGILSPQLDELVGEVRRSLEYHASRYPDAAVRRVVLVGGGSKLKNLDAYFTQQLGIPTAVGNPLARLTVKGSKISPEYIDVHGPAFTVALGLAARDMV